MGMPKGKKGEQIGSQSGEDQSDAGAIALPHGFCFQHCVSPECPKVNMVFPAKSDCRDSPEVSLNATMSDKMEPEP